MVHFDFFSHDKINTVDVQSIENALHFVSLKCICKVLVIIYGLFFYHQEADIQSTLSIQFIECPPGYFLQSQQQNFDFKLCKCNTDNSHIVTCTTSDKILFEVTAETINNYSSYIYFHL